MLHADAGANTLLIVYHVNGWISGNDHRRVI